MKEKAKVSEHPNYYVNEEHRKEHSDVTPLIPKVLIFKRCQQHFIEIFIKVF